jgi:hypothetical protein
MNNTQLLLYVESERGVILLEKLFKRAHYPVERIRILPSNGKTNMANFLKKPWEIEGIKYAALVNFDALTVFDAVKRARKNLGYPAIEIFCAVPETEAWLFADIEAAKRNAYSKNGLRLLNRVSLPEEIPHPRRLAYSVFGQNPVEHYAGIFDHFDIEIAMSKSPSLRMFLEGIGNLLNLNNIPAAEIYYRRLKSNILSNLLSEVSPSKAPIYRTKDGINITAEQMVKFLREGSPLGEQYATDVLRVARDSLAQKAQQEQEVSERELNAINLELWQSS